MYSIYCFVVLGEYMRMISQVEDYLVTKVLFSLNFRLKF